MLDDLIPHALVESIKHLITILDKDLWTICTDPFASHVLQSVMVNALKYIQVRVGCFILKYVGSIVVKNLLVVCNV